MQFIAAINTRIYGTLYSQGATVDTSGWSRKQMLQFLSNGLIQASQVTAGQILESVVFTGGDVATTTDAQGRLVVTIETEPKSIDWLTDVDPAGAADGDVLVWDEIEAQWRPATIDLSGATISIANLSDVDTTGAVDGSMLVYDEVSGHWVIGVPPAGTLAGLEDVDLTSLDEGDVLIYDFSSGTWRPGVVTGAQGPAGPVCWTFPTAWSSAAAYTTGPPASVVRYNGSSYVCIQSHTNVVPTNTSYWSLLAQKGDQGVQGDTGPASTIPGPGVAAGGTAGQRLYKIDGTDYNTGWVTPHEPPSGGSTGQVLAKSSGTNYDWGWVTVSPGVTNLDGLTDVDVSTSPPVTGEVLTYNGTAWVPAAPTGGGGGASALADLTDVDVIFAAPGDILKFTGTATTWVDDSAPTTSVTPTSNGTAVGTPSNLNSSGFPSHRLDGDGNWVRWDFGTPKAFWKIYRNVHPSDYATSIRIEYSDDDSIWTPAQTWNGLGNGTYTLTIDDPMQEHRYWRYVMLSHNGYGDEVNTFWWYERVITWGTQTWTASPPEVPPGGTTGQVLTKLSNTDGDADWQDPTGGSGGTGPTLRGEWGTEILTQISRVDATKSASSSDGGYPVANVHTTGWVAASGTLPAWVQFDYPAPVTVGSYVMRALEGATNAYPTGMQFQQWNGTSWDTLDTRTPTTPANPYTFNSYTLATPATGTRFRIYITATGGGWPGFRSTDLYEPSAATAIVIGDTYTYDGTLYRSLVDNNSEEPGTGAQWEVLELIPEQKPRLRGEWGASTPTAIGLGSYTKTVNPGTYSGDGATATTDTGWNSGGSPSGLAPRWWAIDFGTPTVVGSYAFRARTSGELLSGPGAFRLLGSNTNDGGDWVELDSRSGQTYADETTYHTYNVATPTAYRYYRLNVTAAAGTSGEWMTLRNLTLYAAVDADPTIAGDSYTLNGDLWRALVDAPAVSPAEGASWTLSVEGGVVSTTVTSIVTLTQTAYDALGTPDSATLYVIVG